MHALITAARILGSVWLTAFLGAFLYGAGAGAFQMLRKHWNYGMWDAVIVDASLTVAAAGLFVAVWLGALAFMWGVLPPKRDAAGGDRPK